jgi:hypothetical protein
VTNTAGVGAGLGSTANSWAYLYDGRLFHNGAVGNNTGISVSAGDILMMALDLDAGYLWYGKNGVWMPQTTGGSVGVPSTGSNPTQSFTANQAMSFAVGPGGGTPAWTGNWGQRAFAYTAPSGFKALCTQNFATPAIGATSSTLAGKNFDAVTYTGTGSSLSITSLAFQPDFTWIKGRSGATNHALYDAVRGVQKDLVSNSTSAETTETTGLTAFGSTGFTIGTLAKLNTNSATYAAWNWKANGAGSSNTSGTITSTVSANTTAGISVVTYTGTGANATVGHGLGVAPKFILTKARTGTNDWGGYHASIGNTGAIFLSNTAAVNTNSVFWNNTSPTSTVFTVGTNNSVNSSTVPYVAYCFAEIAGFSKFGSYTGNGSSDGPFVYCGFRPRFVMIKRTDATGNWWIIDTARSTYNVAAQYLFADTSAAEGSDNAIDVLSNGFKLRVATYQPNTSGGTFIFMAFAEAPFNYSRAR